MTAMLSPQILGFAVELGVAKQWRCVIHPDDHLVDYVVKHSPRAIAAGEAGYKIGVGEYFEAGLNDSEQLRAAMRALGHGDEATVLEFAAGYGRMTRHLLHANLVSADVHPQAVSFLTHQLGAHAIQSTLEPSAFNTDLKFDFICAISFFSHVPDHTFGPWLQKLFSLLKPGGHLLFTTIGQGAADREVLASDRLEDGKCAFFPYTDQPDIDPEFYGTMVVTPTYVRRKIIEHTIGHVVSMTERAWWLHQDEWILAAPGRLRGAARRLRTKIRPRRSQR